MADSATDQKIQRLCDEFLGFIRSNPDMQTLPSIASMAKNLRADIHAVSAALHQLRDSGVISFRKGQRIQICGRISAVPVLEHLVSLQKTLSLQLYSSIKEKIVTSAFREGELLPKRAYFARDGNVSASTVGLVYARLLSEGLVHKRGKSFVVGREQRCAYQFSERPAPTILIVQYRPRAWQRLKTMRTERFVSAFMTQADVHNVRLISVSGMYKDGIVTSELDTAAIKKKVSDLGSHYLGTVVVGIAKQFANFSELIRFLLAFGRPVAWPDFSDSRRRFDFQGKTQFFRCTFSEKEFSSSVPLFLHQLGHRTIAYAVREPGHWALKREVIIRSQAKRLRPKLIILTVIDAENKLKSISRMELRTRLVELHRMGPSYARKTISYLLSCMPPHEIQSGSGNSGSVDIYHQAAICIMQHINKQCDENQLTHILDMIILLLIDNLTAIMAPRDYTAERILRKLDMMGISVPGDISLISYDNYIGGVDLPVTTADPGADDLGYRTFHAILGDIPVRFDRPGVLIARPRVVSRGSVREI